MADFLTRLVERAWGQAPTVQPLIPSRYAALPALDSLALAEPSESPTNPWPVARLSLPTPQSPLALTSPAAVETHPETGPAWQSLEPGAEDSAPPRLVSPAPTPVALPDAPLSRPQPPRIEPEPKIDHPRRIAPVLNPLVNQPPAAPQPIRQAANPPPLPDSSPTQIARAATPATVARPIVAWSDPRPATLVPAGAAPLSTVEAHIANGFSRPAPEPPAPSINVTIGRVEVRAVFEPPAKAAPPARPEPKLSLEDYLRTSTGGRR